MKESAGDKTVTLFGDYNSPDGQMLKLQFEKCDRSKRSTCRSDDEISDWLKQKFFLIYHNKERFQNNQYKNSNDDPNAKRVLKESRIDWVKLSGNLNLRQEITNKIKLTDVLMQDFRLIHLDEWTQDDTRMFSPYQMSSRPYEFDDNVHLSVSYELDLNLYII